MYLVRFTVKNGPESLHLKFPLDMLRYDCCFPAKGEDVSWLCESLFHNERVELMLAMYSKTQSKPYKLGDRNPGLQCPVTIDRWLSFGWIVTEIYKGIKV